MHGRSFRAVVEGQTDVHRASVRSPATTPASTASSATTTRHGRQWSLILRPEGEPDELYDLDADPRERDNLIDAQHDVAARLLARFGPTYFRRQRPLLQIKGVQGAYEVASGAVE